MLRGLALGSWVLLASCQEGQLITLGQSSPGDNSGGSGVAGSGGLPNTGGATGGDGGQGGTDGVTEPDAVAGSGGAPDASVPEPFVEPMFGDVRELTELSSEFEDDNPTLTEDLLQIVFSSTREGGPGNTDVWIATRTSPDVGFDEPQPIAEVSTPDVDSSPALSGDGLTLWVGLQLDTGLGGRDIWESRRSSVAASDWSEPMLIAELSSPEDDIPRPLGNAERTMPLASRRAGGMYLTYLATRPTTAEIFAEPELISELVTTDSNTSDAFLTDDGLTLYFARAVDSISDIFVARRPSIGEPFAEAIALSTINTEYDDRDPWLSPDGTRLYFASDRGDGATLNIYEARLISQ